MGEKRVKSRVVHIPSDAWRSRISLMSETRSAMHPASISLNRGTCERIAHCNREKPFSSTPVADKSPVTFVSKRTRSCIGFSFKIALDMVSPRTDCRRKCRTQACRLSFLQSFPQRGEERGRIPQEREGFAFRPSAILIVPCALREGPWPFSSLCLVPSLKRPSAFPGPWKTGGKRERSIHSDSGRVLNNTDSVEKTRCLC